MREICERLGFTPGAAVSLEGNDHVINTLEEVVFLNNKDIDIQVKQLCHQGGMIAGPTTFGGPAQGNPGPLVANPGHCVSIRNKIANIVQCKYKLVYNRCSLIE
jgi:hypothetical protein